MDEESTVTKKFWQWWTCLQKKESSHSCSLWPVSVSVASNADVWPRHTCLASRWLHLCDYTTPLSSESHTHINQWCRSREMITWGVAGWSFRPHTENQPASAFSTSTPQAEAALGWNGIHESWQLMSEALHCKKCQVFFYYQQSSRGGAIIYSIHVSFQFWYICC